MFVCPLQQCKPLIGRIPDTVPRPPLRSQVDDLYAPGPVLHSCIEQAIAIGGNSGRSHGVSSEEVFHNQPLRFRFQTTQERSAQDDYTNKEKSDRTARSGPKSMYPTRYGIGTEIVHGIKAKSYRIKGILIGFKPIRSNDTLQRANPYQLYRRLFRAYE